MKGKFQCTVGTISLSIDEKKKSFEDSIDWRGKERAVQCLGFFGSIFGAAWSTLRKKFGQPHLMISAELSRTQSYATKKYQDSESLVEFANILSNFVGDLQQFGYSNKLLSSSNWKWLLGNCFLISHASGLGILRNPKTFQNELVWCTWTFGCKSRQLGMSATTWVAKNIKIWSQKAQWAFSKRMDPKDRSSIFQAFVSDKKNSNHCPLQDGVHRFWQYETIKKKCVEVVYRIAYDTRRARHTEFNSQIWTAKCG